MEPIWEYTIKLIRFVLNGDVPELPENIDFEKLFAFGKSHGVENMLYVGLRDLHIDVPEETMQKFKTAYEMQIMVEATQALELEAISEAFEEAGIDHVPLKGSVIKYLYPMPDLRKSGDIDILIKEIDRAVIDKIMFALGYKIDEHFEHYEVHYAYKKNPIMEVEIHRQLLKKSNRAYKFCKDPWCYVSKVKDNTNKYIFTNEFMYVYLLAHLCNHLYEGGIGIRHFMDFYEMLKNMKFNEKLLEKYMKKANLTEINAIVMRVINKWFMDKFAADEEVFTMEAIIFKNGSFGTETQREKFRVNDSCKGRLQVLFRRVFLRKTLLKTRYKYLEDKNWPWFIMWMYRVYYVLRYRKEQLARRFDETFSDKYHEKGMENIIRAIKER